MPAWEPWRALPWRHSLPKATGRLVTDLMYRHWDHYVESIQHPFVADVTAEGIGQGRDLLEGEPYECPLEPFGGIEQLAWSPDSKTIAYTCRKKTGTDYAISTDSDIYLYDLATGQTRNLCKPEGYQAPRVDATKTMKHQSVNSEANLAHFPGYDQNPQFSPDGKRLIYFFQFFMLVSSSRLIQMFWELCSRSAMDSSSSWLSSTLPRAATWKSMRICWKR